MGDPLFSYLVQLLEQLAKKGWRSQKIHIVILVAVLCLHQRSICSTIKVVKKKSGEGKEFTFIIISIHESGFASIFHFVLSDLE